MRNSNFGFTFFDAVINFLTGQHTYFLISIKEQSDNMRYESAHFNEGYSGSFGSSLRKDYMLCRDKVNGNNSLTRESESFTGKRQLSSEVPQHFCLSQNFPNPFSSKTMISYQCPMTCFVSLKVYNVMWREITTLVYESESPGTYQVEFDGSGLEEGIYFYRMDTENFSDTKKMFIEKHKVIISR